MKNVSSNESNPGGREDILRFPFLLLTHATIKHATPAIVLAITVINALSTNALTVLVGPQAITPTAAPFVVKPPNPLPVPPPPRRAGPLDPLVAPPSLLPRLVALIHHTPGLGAHETGIVHLSLAKTTSTSTRTFPVTELSTALVGATLLGPLADLSRATFSLRRSLRVSEGVMLRFLFSFITSLG